MGVRGKLMGRGVTLGGWTYTKGVLEMERLNRWREKPIARVVNPKYGTVVVPCGSKLAALQCAAEYWGCSFEDIRDASVWRAEPGAAAVRMPKII